MLGTALFFVSFAQAEAGYRLECPSRDVDHAIRGCTVAIGAGGSNLSTAYATRCVAYWLKGAFSRAAADCEEAIELGTDSPAAYLIRGIAHADKGEHNAAVVEYGRSIELRPTPAAYYNRGTAHAALGEHALALVDLDKAIAGQPPVPQAHINRALVFFANGEAEEVARDLDRAAHLLHHDPEISVIRGQVVDAMRRGGGPGNGRLPVPLFPPSKVIPEVISLELLSAHRLKVRVGSQQGKPTKAPELLPSTHAPARFALPRDSMGECLRLWHPETRTTQRQWKGICRSLDFNAGAGKR